MSTEHSTSSIESRKGDISRLPLRDATTLITPPALWNHSALSGGLVELSGRGGGLTLAMSLVYDAQSEGEPAVWIGLPGQFFYPPDAAASGVDLGSLAVVRVTHAQAAARAADQLIRSGAFGLVVMDMGKQTHLPMPLQMRLVSLAQRHDVVVLALTVKAAAEPSLSSLVSVRAESVCRRAGSGEYVCELRIIKDKRRGPGWTHVEVCHVPDGLR